MQPVAHQGGFAITGWAEIRMSALSRPRLIRSIRRGRCTRLAEGRDKQLGPEQRSTLLDERWVNRLFPFHDSYDRFSSAISIPLWSSAGPNPIVILYLKGSMIF